MLDDFLPYVLQILKKNQKTGKINFELLIYGVGQKLKYEVLSYSNLSWFIEAKRGNYFKNGHSYDLRDSEIRFEECYCDVCNGIMPQDIIDLWLEDNESGFRTLVLHNLLDMKRYLSG